MTGVQTCALPILHEALHKVLHEALHKALHEALHEVLHEALHEVLHKALYKVLQFTAKYCLNNKSTAGCSLMLS